MEKNKIAVKDFWNEASCGEKLYLQNSQTIGDYDAQAKVRYELEPYIIDFADFSVGKGKRVLEIGVGLGSDHQKWAESGAELYGIDLTERAIANTSHRMKLFNLSSNLMVGDAEHLDFENDVFDIVYSWGVIHHSPNTPKAVKEIFRVLKQGGQAKVMIYHKWSFVGYMLWVRYGLMKLNPFITLKEIYDKYLESPGTKAYSVAEAEQLFEGFKDIKIETVLTHGDLLTSKAGQRHEGKVLDLARKVFPRTIVKKLFPKHGLFMLIEAKK